MKAQKPGLTLIDGDQSTLRRKVVDDLLHFRSAAARETLDRLSRRGNLRPVSATDASSDTPPLLRAR